MSTRRTSRHEQGRLLPFIRRGFIVLCNKTRLHKKSWAGFLFLLMILMCLSVTFKLQFSATEINRVPSVKRSSIPLAPKTFRDIVRELDNLATWRPGHRVSEAPESPLFKDPSDETTTFATCQREMTLYNSGTFPRVTLIYSLFKVDSAGEALFYLRHAFVHMFENVTDDVIITADNGLSEKFKATLEDAADICSICRLFFITGNIYEHRNFAARFARTSYLVFADARVTPSSNWLRPLINILRTSANIVVSPQIHLVSDNGRSHSVGLARNELTWDLDVIRGPVTANLLDEAKGLSVSYINQTIISKEVFALRKELFLDLGGFDIIPNITGGEHISFSLKILGCHGNIVSSLCSHVYLTVQNKSQTTGQMDDIAVQPDFFNPTFQASHNNVSVYFTVHSKVWLDFFSTKYYTCSSSRQVNLTSLEIPLKGRKEKRLAVGRLRQQTQTSDKRKLQYLNTEFISYKAQLRQRLVGWKCGTANLRYVFSRRQPDIMAPSKSATYHGYIRSLDGMYAFGLVSKNSPSSQQSQSLRHVPVTFQTWENVVLTRNASQWLGPFSFTNGAFIYRHMWCLTRTAHGVQNILTLQSCVKGKLTQLFSYFDKTIRPAGVMENCVSGNVRDIPRPVSIAPCTESGVIKEFKMDVEFTKDCIN